MKNLLSTADHESARASANNCHYTEIHVIDAMWQAVQRFVEGGRILEPAAGIGHFIGAMPQAIAERSSITAIEIDQLSGRMLHALYALSDTDVRIAPFEKTALHCCVTVRAMSSGHPHPATSEHGQAQSASRGRAARHRPGHAQPADPGG